jgi:TonB family protein
MVIRATSPNAVDAREAQDKNPAWGEERAGRRNANPSRAIPPGTVRQLQDLRTEKKVVTTALPLDRVLQEITQQARLATNATGAFIGLERGGKVVYQAKSGSTAGELVAYLDRDQRMVDSCLRNSTPQLCRDSEVFEELDGSLCRYLGARSVVILPILGEAEEKLGVFGVFSPQVGAFSNATVAALQSFCRRVGDAVAQANQCASVSSDDVSAQAPAGPKVLPMPSRPFRTAIRPLVRIRGSVVWIVGISAAMLLGWTLSGSMSRWAMHTSAKAPAAASSPVVPPGAAVVAPQPASSLAAPSSERAATIARETARAAVVVKAQNPETATGGQSATHVPGADKTKKIAGRPGLHVPDLEIENALDDASSESMDSSTTLPSASPVRVPERIALDHVAERLEPDYPANVRERHVHGSVTIDVVVATNGQVDAVKLVDGDPRFFVSAAKAVRKWHFTPLTRDGQPVSFESHITLHFALP